MMDEWTFTINLPREVNGKRSYSLSQFQNPSGGNGNVEIRHCSSGERDSLIEASQSFAGGWSFTSPYWNLSSKNLLSITYGSAWQNLPEFTTQQTLCKTSCCSFADSRKGRDFTTQVFSTDSVVQVDQIQVTIPGVGPAQALQVHLANLQTDHLPNMPPQYQGAWDAAVSRMRQQEESDFSTEGPVITFALPSDHIDPPLLWKVELPGCSIALSIETVSVLDGQLFCRDYSPSTHIYINGYQSWTFAGSVVKGNPQPTSAVPDSFSRAFNHGGSPPPASDIVISTNTNFSSGDMNPFYVSDFFTCITSDGSCDGDESPFPYQQLDETGGPSLLLGWLAQKEQFGVITANAALDQLQMHCSADGQIILPESSIITDWAYAQLITPHSYDEEPMIHYLHAVGEHNNARPLQNGTLLTGWCSWYVFYEKISERILKDNFAQLASMRTHVPTNVAVVDDGYMTAWGDWSSLKPKEFPSGSLSQVAKDIEDSGMRPGVWLAPFAADKKSKLTTDHPEWVIRNHTGSVANSSFCGKFFHGLDVTNPEVQEHVTSTIQRAVNDWGYNVLKIDFLYACCLEGNSKYDLSMSRAQSMYFGMQTIREAAGESTFLIGCGCPIASGIEFVDAMRVSADTGPCWYPERLPWWDNGTLPSLRAMIRNSLSRAPLGHRWWHNDPDCIMLGRHTKLTDKEVASAATVVAMTCGMLLLSDDVPKVDPGRAQIVAKIFPLTGIPAIVLDLHSTNDGLPSLMRLWCTDRFEKLELFRKTSSGNEDHNAEATHFARQASFVAQSKDTSPDVERRRSCIHVTHGLGTWTVLSISNWSDRTTVVQVPPPAIGSKGSVSNDPIVSQSSSSKHGYHVFAFWSARYSWIPEYTSQEDATISRRLEPHETEIFHIKPVTPGKAQYVGSDMHFSCGKEVLQFTQSASHLEVVLYNVYRRIGRIFIYIPKTSTDNVRVTVDGKSARADCCGNTPSVSSNGSHMLAGRVLFVPVSMPGGDMNGVGYTVRIDF